MLKPKKYSGFELGHVIIKENGTKCTCGNNGCIETYCSMRVLKEKIKERKNLKEITGQELNSIMQNEMDTIKDVINEFIKDLAIALANYINIFEPEAICIGGSFVYYEETLLDMLKQKLSQDKMTFNNTIPEIFVAEYKNDAGMIGATLI